MSSRASIQTAVLSGVTPVPVTVEADVSPGMPSFHIVGNVKPDVLELEAVVRCAIRAAGYTWPDRNITVNLSPADTPKCGAHLALPIAVAVLAATGQVTLPKKGIYVGELSLDGSLVNGVRGIIAYAAYAESIRGNLVCSHLEQMPSAYWQHTMGIGSLADLRGPNFTPARTWEAEKAPDPAEPFGRAEQAIVEGKSILVIGEPFAMFARICEILPPLSPEEALECASIASCADESLIPSLLGLQRPMREPIPSTTAAGLLGGGMPVRPGEVTLAHHGVLFLGDISRWGPSKLRQLGIARRDGRVRIVRADGVVEMPSEFQLIAYAQPCPCGRYGDPDRECTCDVQQLTQYRRRLESLEEMFDATFECPPRPDDGVISFEDIVDEHRDLLP